MAVGDVIRNRYEVLGLAGQGTFGTVLECYDRKHRETVAVKAVRAVPRYIDAGYVEADILMKIRKADPDRKSYVACVWRGGEGRGVL